MKIKAKFRYKDTEFEIVHDLGDCSEKRAFFMFKKGNYSCDCNRSIFIQEQHKKSSIPCLDCGEQIEMISIENITTGNRKSG